MTSETVDSPSPRALALAGVVRALALAGAAFVLGGVVFVFAEGGDAADEGSAPDGRVAFARD